MRHRLTATLLLLSCLAAPAAAQVRLLETGLICPGNPEGRLTAAPGTIAGHVRLLEGMEFDMPGRTVPMLPGLSFGMRLDLKSGNDVPVRMVTRHPPMGPEGRTEQAYRTVLPGDDTYVRAYAFEFDYEMVEGTWTLSVEVEGEPVVAVSIEVTATSDPRIDRICGSMLQS